VEAGGHASDVQICGGAGCLMDGRAPPSPYFCGLWLPTMLDASWVPTEHVAGVCCWSGTMAHVRPPWRQYPRGRRESTVVSGRPWLVQEGVIGFNEIMAW
jgi:hypothetical protein